MLKTTEKALGILGDSLTLCGSVVLALETLLRHRIASRDRASLRTIVRFTRRGKVIRNADGQVVDEQVLEDKAIDLGVRLGTAGVFLLVAGFLVLLAIRILGAIDYVGGVFGSVKKMGFEPTRRRHIRNPIVAAQVEETHRRFMAGEPTISLAEIVEGRRAKNQSESDLTEVSALERMLSMFEH